MSDVSEWDRLLAEIHGATLLREQAEQAITAARTAVDVELAPYRESQRRAIDQGAAAREALRVLAVANYRNSAVAGAQKTFGGVRLQFRPNVVVHDAARAAMALDGLALVDEVTGEVTLLVTYAPVFNQAAIRRYIETSADLPAPEGWPGVVTLTTQDDPASWVLQILRE